MALPDVLVRPEAFFREPHTIFVWGRDRARVNALVRLLVERFSATFELIELLEPSAPSSVEPAFQDVPGERALRLANPAELLPDPAAMNLSAFLYKGEADRLPDSVEGLLLPEPVRGILDRLPPNGHPNALAVVNADYLGDFTNALLTAFREVDDFLVRHGVALVIGHRAERVPLEEVPSLFDSVLEVIPGAGPADEWVVSEARGAHGDLLGHLVPWSEVERLFGPTTSSKLPA